MRMVFLQYECEYELALLLIVENSFCNTDIDVVFHQYVVAYECYDHQIEQMFYCTDRMHMVSVLDGHH